MICRLCLKDVQCLINIFDELGLELSVAEIISKFFWFEPKPDDPISKAICEACWTKVTDFNEFYIMVEEAHRLLTERFSINFCPQRSKNTTSFKKETAVSTTTSKQCGTESLLETYDTTNFQNQRSIAPIISDVSQDVRMPPPMEEVVCKDNVDIDTTDSNDFGEHDEISTYLTLCEINEMDQDALEDAAPISPTITRSKRLTRAASKEKSLQSPLLNATKRQATKSSKIINTESTAKRGRGRPKKDTATTKSPSPAAAAKPLRSSTKNSPKTDVNSSLDLPAETEKTKQSYKDKIQAGNERIAQFIATFNCDFCSEKHENFATHIRHIAKQHGQRGFVSCCNKKFFKRNALLGHVERHLNPDLFSCKECDKIFSDKQCLQNHINIKHLPEESKTFACEVCHKKFGKTYLLEQHQRTHQERNHICEMCEKGFPSPTQLRAHIKVIHNNYGIMCEICSKVIRGRAAFKRHYMTLHEGVDLPKVQCPKCGSWHKDKYSLQKHIRRHNIDGVQHVCNECGKVAPNRSALLSHKRFVHKAERSYKCGLCKKAFKIQISLKEHMATHTGEALYKCPYCNRTFNSNANMHSHRKKMHPKEFAEARLQRKKIQDSQQINNETDEEQIKVVDEAAVEQAADTTRNQQQDLTIDGSSSIINLNDIDVDDDEETHILMTTDKFGELIFKVESSI